MLLRKHMIIKYVITGVTHREVFKNISPVNNAKLTDTFME